MHLLLDLSCHVLNKYPSYVIKPNEYLNRINEDMIIVFYDNHVIGIEQYVIASYGLFWTLE